MLGAATPESIVVVGGEGHHWAGGSANKSSAIHEQQQQYVLERIRDLTLKEGANGLNLSAVAPIITLSAASDEKMNDGPSAEFDGGSAGEQKPRQQPPSSRLLGVPKIDLGKERMPPLTTTYS